MRQDRRARIQVLTDDLAKSTNPEVLFLREVAALMFEEAKDKLVDATGLEISQFQSEAKTWERFLKALTPRLVSAHRKQEN